MARSASLDRAVILMAIGSRVLCIVYVWVCSYIFSDYHTSSDLLFHVDLFDVDKSSSSLYDSAPSLSSGLHPLTEVTSVQVSNSVVPSTYDFVWWWLKGFVRWDGEYFLFVATHGRYLFEHIHAFFPGYPGILFCISQLLRALMYFFLVYVPQFSTAVYVFLFPSISVYPVSSAPSLFVDPVSSGASSAQESVIFLALGGLLLSNIAFIFASLGVFRLACHILRFYPHVSSLTPLTCRNSRARAQKTKEEDFEDDGTVGSWNRPSCQNDTLQWNREYLAFVGAMFFILSSANIHMSACYTESVFSALTVWGLIWLHEAEAGKKRQSRHPSTIRTFPVSSSPTSLLYETIAVVAFSVAVCLRSNGILLLIPLFFHKLRTSPFVWTQYASSEATALSENSGNSRKSTGTITHIFGFFIHWLTAAAQALCVISPLLIILGLAFNLYCCPDPSIDQNRMLAVHPMEGGGDMTLDVGHVSRGTLFGSPETGEIGKARVIDLCGVTNFLYSWTSSSWSFSSSYSTVDASPLTTSLPVWCYSKIPNIYSHVQRRYWDVYLMSYWRNPSKFYRLLYSLPMYLFAVATVVFFFRMQGNDASAKVPPETPRDDEAAEKMISKRCRFIQNLEVEEGWGVIMRALTHPLAGHVAQLTVLMLYMGLVANAEVFIRLSTGCPIFFIHLAIIYDYSSTKSITRTEHGRSSEMMLISGYTGHIHDLLVDQEAKDQPRPGYATLLLQPWGWKICFLFYFLCFWLGPPLFCNFITWT